MQTGTVHCTQCATSEMPSLSSSFCEACYNSANFTFKILCLHKINFSSWRPLAPGICRDLLEREHWSAEIGKAGTTVIAVVDVVILLSQADSTIYHSHKKNRARNKKNRAEKSKKYCSEWSDSPKKSSDRTTGSAICKPKYGAKPR